MNIKKLKQGVFTVEASFIVPIAALVLAMLMGYAYFMHERAWSKAVSYEAAMNAVQYEASDKSIKKYADERLEARYSESVTGLSKNNSEVSESDYGLNISWSYGILEKAFGDVFTFKDEISVRKIKPSTTKRLMWAAKLITE